MQCCGTDWKSELRVWYKQWDSQRVQFHISWGTSVRSYVGGSELVQASFGVRPNAGFLQIQSERHWFFSPNLGRQRQVTRDVSENQGIVSRAVIVNVVDTANEARVHVPE